MTDALDAIRRLYFTTTAATIEHDFDQAVDLLKSMPTESDRERATAFMVGLAQMKQEWATGSTENEERRTRTGTKSGERRTHRRTPNDERGTPNRHRGTATPSTRPVRAPKRRRRP
jgi:hypothetical protein